MEIYTILKNFNSGFMKDLFRLKRVQGEKYGFRSEILKSNQVIFSTRSMQDIYKMSKGVQILALWC